MASPHPEFEYSLEFLKGECDLYESYIKLCYFEGAFQKVYFSLVKSSSDNIMKAIEALYSPFTSEFLKIYVQQFVKAMCTEMEKMPHTWKHVDRARELIGMMRHLEKKFYYYSLNTDACITKNVREFNNRGVTIGYNYVQPWSSNIRRR